MEIAIQEVVRRTGVTSRTLRHWADAGLLTPSRVGAGGLRHYDDTALVRLQRILLLRELGLGLAAIREALAGDDLAALRGHVEGLRAERGLLDRRIRSVESTIRRRERGEPLMAEEMFDGFDHRAHREEVTERWGARAWSDSDAWWTAKSDAEKAAFQEQQRALAADWVDAASRGLDPAGAEAQALAGRHAAWLAGVPSTPGYPDGPTPEYLAGLGELYVADPRFGAAYAGHAEFVRNALREYARARPAG